MPSVSNLFRHPKTGVYYFRKSVPEALRPAIGKNVIMRSLRTKDWALAKELAKPVGIWADARLASARETLGIPAPSTPERPILVLDGRTAQILQSWFFADMNEPSPIGATRPTAKPPRHTNSGFSIGAVLEKYLREAAPSQRTSLEYRKTFSLFCEATRLTLDTAVTAVSKSHVRDFKEVLLILPNRMLGKEYRGKTLAEVLAILRRSPNYVRLRPKSVNKHIAALSAVFNYAVRNDYRETNPAACMTLRKTSERARGPYDIGDLRRIFAELLSTNDDWAEEQWLPLLALFSGCRLEEIGQLLVTDIKSEKGFHYLVVSRTDENGLVVKRVKTASSDRIVPIHPTLVTLGFMEYVAERRQSGDRQLFPNLKLQEGKRTIYFSKWWGRQRKRFNILDPRKCFHSFRHTFKDGCRAAGVPEDIHDAITGHSNGSVGRSYGNGHPVAVLHEWISKVAWDVPWEALAGAGRPKQAV